MKTKTLTEHKARKEELDKIKRQILELELTMELVTVTPSPRLNEVEALFLQAPFQEPVVHAAGELWRLLENYTENGHKFSYRDFLVSAAAVGIICENLRCKWFVKLAYNTKPHPNQKKCCAEMRIMKAMLQAGARIVGMAVVGKPQPNDGTIALHPCKECRDLMRTTYRKLFFDHSRFVLAHPTILDREGFTIHELMAFHGEKF